MKIMLKLYQHGTNRYAALIKLCRRHFSDAPSNGFSYYHNHGRESLRSITIGKLLDEAANIWPERRAICSMHEDITLTFAQLRDQANRLGANLLKLGLQPGDRIAMLGPNSIHWCVTALAAAKAGLILVSVNPAYTAPELKVSLNKVGVKAIVTDETFKTQHYYDMLLEIDPALAHHSFNSKIKSIAMPELEYIIVKTDKELRGSYRYKDIMQLVSDENHLYDVSRKIDPDDPVTIQYSSGSTGIPKGITLTHFGVVNNSHFFGARCGYNRMSHNHILCLQVPLFHIFGYSLGLLCNIDYGFTMVFPGPSFKAETSLDAIKREKFTAIYGTPTMYTDLIMAIKNEQKHSPNNKIDEGLCNLNILVSGGALCGPQLFSDMAETLKCSNVHSAYGMTETSPILFTTTNKDTYEQRCTTVGRVASLTEVKIVDNNGKMVPFGTPGELWIRSYATMLKYWGEEGKSRETITKNNWLKTGDLMVLNQDGYGKIVGRIKDVVIRGGENIFPSEVENFLQRHPDILEAYVYGVSDNRMGEEVGASIKLIPGSTLTEQSVKDYCKGKIAHFKIPRYIKFVEDFPKTASGKIKKFVLREMMEKEQAESLNE